MPYHGQVTYQQIYHTFFSQSIYSSINNWMKCILLETTIENTMSGIVLFLDSNRKLICLHFVNICQVVMWIWQKYFVNENQWIWTHNNQSEQQKDGKRRMLNHADNQFYKCYFCCTTYKNVCKKFNIQPINIVDRMEYIFHQNSCH